MSKTQNTEVINAFKLLSEKRYQEIASAVTENFSHLEEPLVNQTVASAVKIADQARDFKALSNKEVRAPDNFQESCAYMSAMIKAGQYSELLGHMSDQIHRAYAYYEIPQKLGMVVKAAFQVCKLTATTTLDFLADPKNMVVKGFENLAKSLDGHNNILTDNLAKMFKSIGALIQNIDKPMSKTKEILEKACQKISELAFGRDINKAAVAI